MEKQSKELLEERIKAGIRNLDNLEDGTEAKATAIDGVTKLYKLKIDEAKAEQEQIEKEKNIELEKDRLCEEKKSRYCKLGMDAATLGVTLLFNAYFAVKGFKFEETGTFVSKTFRGLSKGFKFGRR